MCALLFIYSDKKSFLFLGPTVSEHEISMMSFSDQKRKGDVKGNDQYSWEKNQTFN